MAGSIEGAGRRSPALSRYFRWEIHESADIGGEKAVAPLIEALKDEANNVRWRAAEALELIKIESLTKGLLAAILHRNSFVRRKAAEVIGYYSHEQSEKKLEFLAEGDPDLEVKQAAQNTIARLDLKKKFFS